MLSLILALTLGQSIELPKELKTTVGVPVTLKPVQVDGTNVSYWCGDSGSMTLVQDELADKTSALFIPRRAKTYTVLAVTAKGDKVSKFVEVKIVVSGEDLDPGVDPNGPKPSDPLAKTLAELLKSNPEADTKPNLVKLAASLAEARGGVDSCATLDDFDVLIKSAYLRNGVAKALSPIRIAVGRELISKIGDIPDTKMNAAIAEVIKNELKRYEAILKKLAE